MTTINTKWIILFSVVMTAFYVIVGAAASVACSI